MNRSPLCLLALCLVTVLGVVGCGKAGSQAEVRGQVLLDGQPLANAEIQLLAKDGRSMHSGTTDANGKFVIVEPAGSNTPIQPGDYVALVSKQSMPENAASLPGGGMGAMVNVVPPIYQDRTASPLSVKVESTTTELPPFQLSKDAK